MTFDAWRFSAQQCWRQPALRALTLTTALLVLAGSGFFLWKMIPARQHDGTLILHYNVYLGIDDIRAWTWALLLPAVWLIVTAADLLLAFGAYRHDPHFAAGLVSLAFLWSLPCALGLFYLTRVNG